MAPRAERRLPVDCWASGEGEEVFELDRGMLWRKLASWVDFGQNLVQVFVVEDRNCGGCLDGILGGLERWSSGELRGGFWEGSVVCGAGNSEVEGVGFWCWWFRCLGSF